MSALFEWHERGDRLAVWVEPGSLVRVGVETDARQGSVVELPLAAVVQLRRALLEVVGDPDLAAAHEQLAATESALDRQVDIRDRALADSAEAERVALDALGEVQQLRTALDLADRRVQALERDLDRVRAAEERAEERADELKAELEGRYPTVRRVRA